MLSRATRTLEVAGSWDAFAVTPVFEAVPVAGRPPELPAAPLVLDAVPVIPRQRNAPELRRRVPGNQLPAEAAPKMLASVPTTDDAIAAREAFDAFETGVHQAQNAGTGVPQVQAARNDGNAPLTRRVPGATLPLDQPRQAPPAPAAAPLDPDAARALMEQFESGVARALNETQPQTEGQPR